MEPKFQNTFIPKRPIETNAQKVATPKIRKKVSIGGMLITLIFILTLAAAGGVFAYARLLQIDIANSGKLLEEAKDDLEPELIRELAVADAQIELAETILFDHLAPSRFFEHLEEITLQNVQFTNFVYSAETGGGAFVTMSGIAPRYEVVALQSDVFARDEFVNSSLFSDLSETEDGDIAFNVEVNMSSRLMLYKN